MESFGPRDIPGLWTRHRFRRSPRSGLLIPVRRQQRDPQLNPARFVRTYVGFEDVHGRKATWDDAADRLREYSLHAILATIGRISGELHASDLSESLAVQDNLISWLFQDRGPAVGRAANRLLAAVGDDGTDFGTPVLAFHQLQLINAAKLALLEVPPDNKNQNDSPIRLGEALLAVNDLLGREETLGDVPSEIDDADDRRKWARFLLANGRFHSFDNPGYELARSRELYLTDRPHLRETAGDYMDLPGTAERLIGLPLEQLMTRNAAVYLWWARGRDNDTGELPPPIELDTFFTENFDFDPEEELAFWQFIGETPRRLRQEFREAGCGDGTLRPYYVLPFEKHPLVIHDGRAYAPSTLHLARKVTSGLHHVFLNRLHTEEARDQYLAYFGDVFEDYVRSIIGRMFGNRPNRLVDETTIGQYAPEGASICDAVITYPNAAVVLEFKSQRLKLGARTEGDWDETEEFLDRVFRSGAEQLDSTIELIEAGGLAEVGLNPDRIRSYLPVIVTLEPVHMQPYLYRLIDSEFVGDGLLANPKVRSLQQLDVGDLEMLESAVNRGHEFRAILEHRVEQGGHTMDFTNYAWEYDRSLVEGPNEQLREQFSDMADSAVEYLRSRRPDED